LTAALLGGGLALAASGAASAATMFSSFTAWSVAVSNSCQTTSGEGGADFTSHTSIGPLLCGSTLSSINPSVETRTVGTSWSTWQGQPGSDGTTVFFDDTTSLTANFTPGTILGHPVDAFGFYMEPDTFSTFDITLHLSDGSEITQSVNGDGGADFFGWVGSGITGITITTTDDGGFAFGDFFEGFAPGAEKVPEPLTLSLFGAGLAGAAALRRRRKSAA